MKQMKIKRIIHSVILVLGLSLLGLLFYYLLAMIADEEFLNELLNSWPMRSRWILVDYLACCLFTTVVTLYYWRSREKAEKERDKFRLQALENQLSPHFVFNNFSILADLIEVDPKRASDYLMNLSKVYRYTLSHLDHNLVTLQEELDFLDRYLALLKQRFGECIQVRIAPDVTSRHGKLPPAALQMLIENAIKHNEHTQTHPLIIDVTTNMSDGQRICVCNRKQTIENEDSANVGHHNIVERYRLMTSRKVIIRDTQEEYCVSIPLIPIER